VRVTNEYYNRIILVEYCILFLAVFGVALSMVLNEIKLNLEITTPQENLINTYITISTVALVAAIYLR
jgi:hypothetical protein